MGLPVANSLTPAQRRVLCATAEGHWSPTGGSQHAMANRMDTLGLIDWRGAHRYRITDAGKTALERGFYITGYDTNK